MKNLKEILMGMLIVMAVGMLASCGANEPRVRGVVLPHHNLVGEWIGEFYGELAGEVGDVERVIVISTNHFDTGYYFVQGAMDVGDLEVDEEFVKKLADAGVLGFSDVGLDYEHGVMVHMDYIEKYFPNVKVVPISLKWATPEKNLDRLVEAIFEAENGGAGEPGDLAAPGSKTLVVASIDFSHYVDEEVALKNDQRTTSWFEKWGDGGDPSTGQAGVTLENLKELEKSFELRPGANMDYKGEERPTAMDSPETLYVFTELMGDVGKVEVWKRTSSASTFGVVNPSENTSHLFVKVW